MRFWFMQGWAALRLGFSWVPVYQSRVSSKQLAFELGQILARSTGRFGRALLVVPLAVGELLVHALLAFWPAKMDFASASDGGDKWRFEFAGEMAHFWYGKFERGGHIFTGHIAGSKDKLANGVFLKSALFEEVVTNPFVGGQQDPALRAHQRQPGLIRSAPRKMSKVTLETDAEFSQGVLNRARIAEIFVEVKDKLFRRPRGGHFPSGWPLRSAAACSHILRPAR